MARSVSVILQRDVPHLGEVGEIVAVRPGYARNYLIPKGLALVADERNVRRLEHQKRLTEHRRARLRAESEGLAGRLREVTLTIPAKAGEQDKLFGSVGPRDIAKALAEHGFEIPHRWIKLDEPIKKLGEYQVKVRLQAEVYAEVKVLVVPESAEEQVAEEEDVAEAVVGVAPEFRSLDYY